MIQTIKELFTAYYDEGEIRGCRKYSLAWYHEYRHQIQMKIKILNKIWTWLPYITGCLGLIMLWFFYLVPERTTLIWGGIFILPITLFMLGLELDANIYAVIKKISKFTLTPSNEGNIITVSRESSVDSPNSNPSDLNSRGKPSVSNPSPTGRET